MFLDNSDVASPAGGERRRDASGRHLSGRRARRRHRRGRECDSRCLLQRSRRRMDRTGDFQSANARFDSGWEDHRIHRDEAQPREQPPCKQPLMGRVPIVSTRFDDHDAVTQGPECLLVEQEVAGWTSASGASANGVQLNGPSPHGYAWQVRQRLMISGVALAHLCVHEGAEGALRELRLESSGRPLLEQAEKGRSACALRARTGRSEGRARSRLSGSARAACRAVRPARPRPCSRTSGATAARNCTDRASSGALAARPPAC